MQDYMIFDYEFPDNSCAELCGDNIKFWQGTGLPDFEGSLDGFKMEFPKYFKHLLDNNIVKAK
jgi:hypothetical protein